MELNLSTLEFFKIFSIYTNTRYCKVSFFFFSCAKIAPTEDSNFNETCGGKLRKVRGGFREWGECDQSENLRDTPRGEVSTRRRQGKLRQSYRIVSTRRNWHTTLRNNMLTPRTEASNTRKSGETSMTCVLHRCYASLMSIYL